MCALCKRDRSYIISLYERIRTSINYWYNALNGARAGLCVGFWSPHQHATYFDVIMIRKSPIAYLGVPLQILDDQTFCHDTSKSEFICPSRSKMYMPNVFESSSNCLLDFISKLPFDPLYIIYCAKDTVEIVSSEWICVYSNEPLVFDIASIILDDTIQPKKKKGNASNQGSRY